MDAAVFMENCPPHSAAGGYPPRPMRPNGNGMNTRSAVRNIDNDVTLVGRSGNIRNKFIGTWRS
jgi:hypothetical protein